MAGIHHWEDDIGDAREVLPHLPDSQIVRGRGREPENVERDRHAERAQPALEKRDVLAHRLTLALPRPVGREDGGREALARLVREAYVVELYLRKAEPHGLGRELGRIDPHRVVVRVHPRDVDPVAPLTAVARSHRPLRLTLGEPGVLGHHDARDRIDAVGKQRIEARPDAAGADAVVRADLLGRLHRRRIEQAAGVVLDVDHEGVDLGRVGEVHEVPQLVRAERPRVHVQRLDAARRREQERLRLRVSRVDPEAGWQLVGRDRRRAQRAVGNRLLRKEAATRCERGPEQQQARPS